MELAQSSLGEQILRFLKNDLSWFNRIFLLFDTRKSCVFQIFLLRSIKAYLCPNINFDGVDFSERHPEEVISFFWRSVYVYIVHTWMESILYNCFLICFVHVTKDHRLWSLEHRRTWIWHFRKWKTRDFTSWCFPNVSYYMLYMNKNNF